MINAAGRVEVPTYPPTCYDVTKSDSTIFNPSVVIATNGTITVVPAWPSNATAVTWTTTQENFVIPHLCIKVMSTGTSATDIKRVQVADGL